jgi:hypothetical protein
MGRGASFNLRPSLNPGAAEIHNLRLWSPAHPEPGYLLPEPHGGGHWTVIEGDVDQVFSEKMGMRSRQARQDPKFSPVWEGVLNLPPAPPATRQQIDDQVMEFQAGLEKLTGWKVIRVCVHMDEGRIDGDQVKLNGHAHFEVDRTDERGRAIIQGRDVMRAVQDLAAQATGLDRGEAAAITKVRHLSHQAYRSAARSGRIRGREDIEADQARLGRAEKARLEAEQVKIRAEKVAQMAAVYGEIRGLMKASGEARQVDYQELKARAKDESFLQEQWAIWEKKAEQKKAAARLAELDLKLEQMVVQEQRIELQKQQVLIDDLKSKPAESDRWRDAVFRVAAQLSAKTSHQVWWVLAEIAKAAGTGVPAAWSIAYDRARRARGQER